MRKSVVFLVFCYVAQSFVTSAPFAAEGPINFYVEERAIERVAEDLSSVLGIPVVITHKVSRNVQDLRLSGSPGNVIAQFSKRLGFVYNFDGRRYELTPVAN